MKGEDYHKERREIIEFSEKLSRHYEKWLDAHRHEFRYPYVARPEYIIESKPIPRWWVSG